MMNHVITETINIIIFYVLSGTNATEGINAFCVELLIEYKEEKNCISTFLTFLT